MVKIHVLLVEDDPFWQKNLEQDLNNEPDIQVVAKVSTKDEALSQIRNQQIDVVLMDINLTENNLDGIEVMKEIKEDFDLKIIVLTSFTERTIILNAFENGALNLINKSNVKDLKQAIRECYSGNPSIHYDSADILRIEYLKLKKTQILTQTEREVYALEEQGLTKSQIAQTLNKSVHTIKNQLKSIREKLMG